MTKTDKLRTMRDELGVKWWDASPSKTKWHSSVLGAPVAAREWNGSMVLDAGYEAVTPEQAIAATLGRTCRMVSYTDVEFEVCQASDANDFKDYTAVYECSECGSSFIIPKYYDSIVPQSEGWEPWPMWRCCPVCRCEIAEADWIEDATMLGGAEVRQ